MRGISGIKLLFIGKRASGYTCNVQLRIKRVAEPDLQNAMDPDLKGLVLSLLFTLF